MNEATRDLVRRRAGYRCEYCRIHQDDDPLWPFHIEHIIARQHRRSDHLDGLALACHECNLRKGPNLGGIDPETDKKVWLFNPRAQKWKRHFQWRGPVLLGRTACGRATIAVLGINLPDNVALRAMLIKAGTFPPVD
jgi:hypothetical protein